MAWSAPRTWIAAETLTAALMNQELRDNLNAAFPVGSVHYFMQAATTTVTAVNGFALEGNGSAPARATYASLNSALSALSYPFGSGDGATTFTLPDIQGRGLVGMASGGHVDVNGLGDSDGYTKTTRTPKHNSSDTLAVGSGGAHTHTYSFTGIPAGGNIQSGSGYTSSSSNPSTSSDGLHTHTLSGSVGPGGTRPDDVVPYLVAGIFAVKY